mgnify:FL=1
MTMPPVIGQIFSIIAQLVGYAILLLIAAAVMQKFGVRLPAIPTIGATELAYLCGAYWLARGR